MRQIRSHAGLRGIAALLVVGYHLQLKGTPLPWPALSAFLLRSYLMVDLFFVLSGFIICYVNAGDRPAAMPAAEAKDFYLRRLIRLAPLHLFCLAALAGFTALLALGYALAGHPGLTAWWDGGAWSLLAQTLLLSAWLPSAWGWNTPSWSISAELVAYLLFPLFVAARARASVPTQAAVLAGSVAWYAVVAGTTGSLDIIAGLAPLRCIAGFSLGCLIYLHRERVAALPTAALTLLLGVAAVAAPLLMVAAYNDVLLVPVFCVLVACSWTDAGPVARLLGSRPLVALGDISYSVYLTHVPVIAILGVAWSRLVQHLPLAPGMAALVWLLICYAAVLLVSRWTFSYVEVAARRWLSRGLRHRRAQPIELAAPAP